MMMPPSLISQLSQFSPLLGAVVGLLTNLFSFSDQLEADYIYSGLCGGPEAPFSRLI